MDKVFEKKLFQLFRSVDKDSDGHIDKRELILALRRHPELNDILFLKTPTDSGGVDRQKAYNELWELIDSDHSRTIEWNEFLSYFQRCEKSGNLNKAGLGAFISKQDSSIVNNISLESMPKGEGSMAEVAIGVGIAILGKPYSGKTTQCEKICEEFNLVMISPAVAVRSAILDGTDVGREAQWYMDAGQNPSPDVMARIIADRLNRDDSRRRGWCLDGYPSTDAQAKGLLLAGVKPDLVIILDIRDSAVTERVNRRLSDDDDGRVLREARNRLDIFKSHEFQFESFYDDIIRKIDANAAPQSIYWFIQQVITRLLTTGVNSRDAKGYLTDSKLAMAAAGPIGSDPKEYLFVEVMPLLRQGLYELSRARPTTGAASWLSRWLLRNDPTFAGSVPSEDAIVAAQQADVRWIRDIFRELDRDEDDLLWNEELTMLILRLSNRIAGQDAVSDIVILDMVEDVLERCSMDDLGRCGAEELLAIMDDIIAKLKSYKKESRFRHFRIARSPYGTIEALYNDFDRDKDGILTLEEIALLLRRVHDSLDVEGDPIDDFEVIDQFGLMMSSFIPESGDKLDRHALHRAVESTIAYAMTFKADNSVLSESDFIKMARQFGLPLDDNDISLAYTDLFGEAEGLVDPVDFLRFWARMTEDREEKHKKMIGEIF